MEITANILKVIVILCNIIHGIKSSTWDYSVVQLPSPAARQFIGFNQQTADVYLFGGYVQTEPNSEMVSNVTWKWNMENGDITFTELDVYGTVNGYWTDNQGSVTVGDNVYLLDANAYFYKFNMKTETFVSVPQFANRCPNGCLTHNTTHILYYGGYNWQYATCIGGVQILDIGSGSSNKWMYYDYNMPYTGYWMKQACITINNTITYTFGGFSHQYMNGIFKYDINSYQWEFIGNLTADQMMTDSWTVYSDQLNRIYIVGGYDVSNAANGTQGKVLIFDVNSERFIGQSMMLDWVDGITSLIYRNSLYVFGGDTTNGGEHSQIQFTSLPLLF